MVENVNQRALKLKNLTERIKKSQENQRISKLEANVKSIEKVNAYFMGIIFCFLIFLLMSITGIVGVLNIEIYGLVEIIFVILLIICIVVCLNGLVKELGYFKIKRE